MSYGRIWRKCTHKHNQIPCKQTDLILINNRSILQILCTKMERFISSPWHHVRLWYFCSHALLPRTSNGKPHWEYLLRNIRLIHEMRRENQTKLNPKASWVFVVIENKLGSFEGGQAEKAYHSPLPQKCQAKTWITAGASTINERMQIPWNFHQYLKLEK